LNALWRIVSSIVIVGSLIFTVPIALWITVAIAAAVITPASPFPHHIWWADYLGWAVMGSVTIITLWGAYRLCKPLFTEEAQ
jgi:uncharacterized BrkB/YihY/UPF0761 family membrane protein